MNENTDSPKVHLISATPNPRAILKLCWDIITNPGFPLNADATDITELGQIMCLTEPVFDIESKETATVIREFLKSGLGGPLEMINFVFGFEGVTRAFTHQIVRTRLASYMQQSQRFTDFEEGLPVKIPQSVKDCVGDAECGQPAIEIWEDTMKSVTWACSELKSIGVPIQDVRGLYPTNVKTNIIQSIDYNALRRMLSHRLCTQAQQEEWSPIATRIKQIVTAYDPILGEGLAPACQLNGKCAFDTILDRPCEIRENLKIQVSKSKLKDIMRSLVSYGGYDWAKQFLDEDVLNQIGDFGGEVTEG